jgi:hypothetical protein
MAHNASNSHDCIETRKALKIVVRGESRAETAILGDERTNEVRKHRSRPGAGGPNLPPGIHPTPSHDLLFRGGTTIPDLSFVNLYVAGDTAWDAGDKTNINSSAQAIMTEPKLNAIVSQYFQGAISASFAGGRDLSLPVPAQISRGDIDDLVRHAVNGGLIDGNLDTTIFNFLLPPGTVLTDDDPATGNVPAARLRRRNGDMARRRGDHPLAPQPDDQASSLQGLGGYHGSVHLANQRVYFAVGVYSQHLTTGGDNGIVAFDQPWKNVVATFYHEMQEFRTDPDVEDAIRTNTEKLIGWNSRRGEEIGDFPIFEDPALSGVFVEINLTGGGTAPVQLVYSNRVHGPEVPA